jgi:hypothetical protein
MELRLRPIINSDNEGTATTSILDEGIPPERRSRYDEQSCFENAFILLII